MWSVSMRSPVQSLSLEGQPSPQQSLVMPQQHTAFNQPMWVQQPQMVRYVQASGCQYCANSPATCPFCQAAALARQRAMAQQGLPNTPYPPGYHAFPMSPQGSIQSFIPSPAGSLMMVHSGSPGGSLVGMPASQFPAQHQQSAFSAAAHHPYLGHSVALEHLHQMQQSYRPSHQPSPASSLPGSQDSPRQPAPRSPISALIAAAEARQALKQEGEEQLQGGQQQQQQQQQKRRQRQRQRDRPAKEPQATKRAKRKRDQAAAVRTQVTSEMTPHSGKLETPGSPSISKPPFARKRRSKSSLLSPADVDAIFRLGVSLVWHGGRNATAVSLRLCINPQEPRSLLRYTAGARLAKTDYAKKREGLRLQPHLVPKLVNHFFPEGVELAPYTGVETESPFDHSSCPPPARLVGEEWKGSNGAYRCVSHARCGCPGRPGFYAVIVKVSNRKKKRLPKKSRRKALAKQAADKAASPDDQLRHEYVTDAA